MASFKEKYEEMFGKTPDFDPISLVERTQDRADGLMETMPTATPDPIERVQPPVSLPRMAPQGDDSGFIENLGRQFGAGVVQAGELGLGAAEYVARQNEFLDGVVADTIYGGRKGLAGFREDILSKISQEDLQKAAGELLTLDPEKTIWQGNPLEVAESFAYKFANALPATLVTLIPAVRWFKAATPAKALTYMGATEGGMSLGGIANGITDEIMSMGTEQLLAESPRFNQLMEAYGDEAEARDALVREAQGAAPIIGGAAVAAISATAGRFLQPVFEKPGAALASRVGRGFAAEAPPESAQGGVEQFIQNYAARVYDLDRQLSEGVAEAMAQEGALGGLMGGAFGGIAGQRPDAPAPPPAPPVTTPATPPTPPTIVGEEVSQQFALPGFATQEFLEEKPEPPVDPRIVEQQKGMDTLRDNRELDLSQPGLPMSPEGQQRTMPLPIRERGGFRIDAPGTDPSIEFEIPPAAAALRDRLAATEKAEVDLRQDDIFAGPSQFEPPIDEEIRQGIRRNLDQTFEERQAALDAVGKPRSYGQAADRLIGEATASFEQEEKARIGGFYSPTQLEFQSPEYEQAYSEAWKKLVIADMTASTATNEKAAERASARKQALFQELGKIRQVAKPKLRPAKSSRLLENARNINPAEVRAFADTVLPQREDDGAPREYGTATAPRAVEDDYIGEFQARDRKDIDNLAHYTVRHKNQSDKKWTEEEFDDAAAAYARQKELKEKYPKRQVTVDVKGTRALDEEFERAVTFREGRESESKKRGKTRKKKIKKEEQELAEIREEILGPAEQPKPEPEKPKPLTGEVELTDQVTDEGEYVESDIQDDVIGDEVSYEPRINREDYKTPGDKLKFIRREAEHKRRRDTGQKSVKAATVRRSATDSRIKRRPGESEQEFNKRVKNSEKRKKFDTQPLTVENYTLDESVADRVKREARAKTALAEVGKAATRAKKHLASLSKFTKAETAEAYGDQVAGEFLFALDYLRQLIEFAKSIQATKSKSNETIELAEGVTKMLDILETDIQADEFAVGWGGLARKNSFDDLAALKNTSLASMRDQRKRIKATNTSNSEVRSRSRLRELNSFLSKDQLYQNMLKPVFEKMSNYVADIVAGRKASPYIPNEAEIAEIRYAMQTIKNNWSPARLSGMGENMQAEFAEFAVDRKVHMYDPLRAQLEYVGFTFDKNGNVTGFEASPEYLNPPFSATFGGETEGGEFARRTRNERYFARVAAESKMKPEDVPKPPVIPAPPEHYLKSIPIGNENQTLEEAIAALDARKAGRKVPEPQRVQRLGLMTIDTINTLIEHFQSATSSNKTTINTMKRMEERFLRGLRKIGVWKQTSPSTGLISLPGGKSKTYRLIAPRLESKSIQKAAARDYIQKIAKFPVPKGMLAEVREARKSEDAQAAVSKFLDDNATELFNETAQPVKYDADYVAAAELVGDQLVFGTMNGNDVISTLMSKVPQDSFYYKLLEKLRTYDMSTVEVTFGTEGDFNSGVGGTFRRAENLVLLNRDNLRMGQLNNDRVRGARVVHTLTHELIHSLTHKAIDSNPALRQYIETLQKRARQAFNQRYPDAKKEPYGLKVLKGKPQNEAHEFVAEAFSNNEFQEFLTETALEPGGKFSLWKALVDMVRKILGIEPTTSPTNLFDAIMLTEDVLFDDAGFGGTRGDLNLIADETLSKLTNTVEAKVKQAGGFFERLKNASRNLMTFEQLRDTYSKFFNSDSGNSFQNYMDAWGRRNASVSQLMKVPEKLSSRWTSMEQSDPAAALEISRIGTEATMYRLSPTRPLTDKELTNEKFSTIRKTKHHELRERFKALSPEAQQMYKDVTSYYRESVQEEAKLLLSASLRGILTKGVGAPLTTEQYKAKFTNAVIDRMVDEASIRAELSPHFKEEDELDGLIKEVVRMSSLRQQGMGDYFPLMRYGDYVVWAETLKLEKTFVDRKEAMAARRKLVDEDPTLDVSVFQSKHGNNFTMRVMEREFVMSETKTGAEEHRKRLVSEGYKTVSPVQMRLSRETEETAISSNAALNSILTSLKDNPAAVRAVKNHYLQSLSDQSFRKHELKRKNRRGVDYDSQHRNLANYSKQSAYYRSQLAYGWQMGEALRDMIEFTRARPDSPQMSTEQLQRVVENVKYRDKMTHDPQELDKWVRQGVELTQFMMLTSPSYWMINATQPWLVTAPIMGGKHGMGASYSALKHAFSLVKTPLASEALKSWGGLKALKDRVAAERAFNVIDQLKDHLKQNGGEQYIELIDELRDQNVIDINVMTELREIGQGIEGSTWSRVLDSSRILAHITEVNNRVVTAIAAYNLEFNRTGDVAAAKKYAADMVSQTQFNYSTQNKPPLFQSGGPMKWAAPLMFQFMQWPQHMYALLIRNVHAAVKGESKEVRAAARNSLIGLLGTHAAVGGMVGMALQPIKWALGMIMFAFGDDDEPYTIANAINGRTFDNLITEIMTDMFGSTLGGAFSRGLLTVIGADLSARMSMGTLYFVDLRGDTAESVLGSLVASFGGATLNQALNWGNALGHVADGNILRGVEQASPKIARDALRAIRYYNEGLVNNSGDSVIPAEDMSFADIFMQTAGFQPDKVSTFYQGQAAIKGAQSYAYDRREALLKAYATGEDRADVVRDVLEFNRAYPSMKINRSTLLRNLRSKKQRERRYSRYGANIDEQEAQDFAEYGDPYR